LKKVNKGLAAPSFKRSTFYLLQPSSVSNSALFLVEKVENHMYVTYGGMQNEPMQSLPQKAKIRATSEL
jgi:hypothetical protein